MKKKANRLMNLVPLMLLWLVLSVIGWGFVFTRITTYAPEEKIALYVDGEVPLGKELAAYLYEEKQEGIKTVEVRPFTYAMFGGDELRNADLFIIPEESVDTYLECFAPWPEGLATEGMFYARDGVNLGLQVYDTEGKVGVADGFIAYENTLYLPQNYYLFFGNQSAHLEDGLAVKYAQRLLNAE